MNAVDARSGHWAFYSFREDVWDGKRDGFGMTNDHDYRCKDEGDGAGLQDIDKQRWKRREGGRKNDKRRNQHRAEGQARFDQRTARQLVRSFIGHR